MKKVITLFCLALLAGCSGLNFLNPTGASVCDGIVAGDSMICDVAKVNGTTPEASGNLLILVNAVAIGQGSYTADQALMVLGDIQAALNSPVISYLDLNNKIRESVKAYPGLFDIISLYASLTSPELIREADRQMLNDWLTARIKNLEASK